MTVLMLLAFVSSSWAYDSASTFRGVKMTATVYGATCSGGGFSLDCYARPGDRITLSYALENTETIVKDVCLIIKPTGVSMDSKTGVSQDKAHSIYCMGAVCDAYSTDQCFTPLAGGGKASSRFEFKSPEKKGNYGFETLFYVKSAGGKDHSTAANSFHSVECLSDSDCVNRTKCAGHVCGAIATTTTTTTTTQRPIIYDYEANKTVQDNFKSTFQNLKEQFFRLPLWAEFFIAFFIVVAVLIILDQFVTRL